MNNNIVNYCKSCSNYQRVQIHRYKLYKVLFLISLNFKLFYIVIMNFITNISSTKDSYIEKTNDVILTLLDKLIKYVIYISIIKDLNAKDLANVI